jgi:hypothetical protein
VSPPIEIAAHAIRELFIVRIDSRLIRATDFIKHTHIVLHKRSILFIFLDQGIFSSRLDINVSMHVHKS